MIIDTRKKEATEKEGFTPNVQNAVIPASYNGFELTLFILFSILTLSIFFFIVYIGKKNWFNKMQIKANTATSNIEVQLKYRRDTLIKLVEASKSAINYEKKLLTDITAMRSKSFNIKDDEGRKNAMALEQLGAKINAVLENYPKLEAIATIEKLMVTADYSEREIAASRRLYNGVVEEFNAALYRFPTKIVAAQLKLYNLPLFAASTIDKQDVNLSLE